MEAKDTKLYHVISDFVDSQTEELVLAGSTFEIHDERVQAFRDAQVIGKEVSAEPETAKDDGKGEQAAKDNKVDKKDKKAAKETSGDPDAGDA